MHKKLHKIIFLLIISSGIGLVPELLAHAQTTPRALRLVPHRISLANGKSFDLNLPPELAINVAAQGLKRVRFMASESRRSDLRHRHVQPL